MIQVLPNETLVEWYIVMGLFARGTGSILAKATNMTFLEWCFPNKYKATIIKVGKVKMESKPGFQAMESKAMELFTWFKTINLAFTLTGRPYSQ